MEINDHQVALNHIIIGHVSPTNMHSAVVFQLPEKDALIIIGDVTGLLSCFSFLDNNVSLKKVWDIQESFPISSVKISKKRYF
jgi:hypothetical protein